MSGPLEAMILTPLRQKLRQAAAGDETIDAQACQMLLRDLTGQALESDTLQAQSLRQCLVAFSGSFRSGDLAGLLHLVGIAIEYIWRPGEAPPMALVLNDHFLAGLFIIPASGLTAPLAAGDDLVCQGLADEGERLAVSGRERFLNALPSVHILFDDCATHSSLRWLDPAGDRTIVVLPPEYEL